MHFKLLANRLALTLFTVQCCSSCLPFLCCDIQDKENQEDAPENQEDADSNELPETSFQALYKTLKMPGKLPKNQSENLSVPLAFIALLHLCNEQNLALESTGEEFKDFTISRPS